ncbi:Golgi-associated RAB2 interactor protein 5A [Guaruba guarouba]
MGRLRRCLARGELWPLRELRLLESEFVQVTRTGDPAGPITVAVAASCLSSLLPTSCSWLGRCLPALRITRSCSSWGCSHSPASTSPYGAGAGTGSGCAWSPGARSSCSSWLRPYGAFSSSSPAGSGSSSSSMAAPPLLLPHGAPQ